MASRSLDGGQRARSSSEVLERDLGMGDQVSSWAPASCSPWSIMHDFPPSPEAMGWSHWWGEAGCTLQLFEVGQWPNGTNASSLWRSEDMLTFKIEPKMQMVGGSSVSKSRQIQNYSHFFTVCCSELKQIRKKITCFKKKKVRGTPSQTLVSLLCRSWNFWLFPASKPTTQVLIYKFSVLTSLYFRFTYFAFWIQLCLKFSPFFRLFFFSKL